MLQDNMSLKIVRPCNSAFHSALAEPLALTSRQQVSYRGTLHPDMTLTRHSCGPQSHGSQAILLRCCSQVT